MSSLSMGILDSLSDFWTQREADFIRLDSSETEYGPGPLLVLYQVPPTIDDDEVNDMISDGAPQAHNKKCRIYRLTEHDDVILDMSLEKSLNYMMDTAATSTPSATGTIARGVPVLLFSGFRNDEMMATYNILGREIYQEMGGQVSPACAKAVPNAMRKQLRQVLGEIAGDHTSATAGDPSS
ncbi:hypothetical protein FisN_13Hh137 [Fistulifera solaris]|uniref:Uncharacterized protein n=1 Tax=Fistulifera solaris TaxID=1519565 RepID=A0A1Z5KP20_FISSO|nr:hypothetical protein FisN_13Hh137 [Fistulifera solaris]|eukprot:GAX27761.1 hypothetical protein FisN_13Hh137 [Fistulifera solaris]